MKRLLLFTAAVSIAFFSSCGKKPKFEPPKEIVNTYWAAESTGGGKYELTFTPSTATYIFKVRNGYTWIDECPYTYDPPAITMEVEWRDPPIQLKGNIESDAITIEILESYDMVRSVEFKKHDPKKEENPTEPTIIGEWKITHKGTITDGIINMEPHTGMAKYTCRYTFNQDGTGWAYYSNEHQESFKWSRRSDDQFELTDWRVETDVLFDLGPYYMSEEWTVLELTSYELTVSYWMLPWTEDYQPYNVIETFSKVDDYAAVF